MARYRPTAVHVGQGKEARLVISESSAGTLDRHGEVRGLTVEEYIKRLGQDLIPLAERCAHVMREALAALEASRGAPSQAVERSRPARISVVFEPRPPD